MTDSLESAPSDRLLPAGVLAALAAHRGEIEGGQWLDLDVAGQPIVVVPDDMVDEVRRRLAGVEEGFSVVPERRRSERRANRPDDHRAPDSDRRRAEGRAVIALSRGEALRAIESLPGSG